MLVELLEIWNALGKWIADLLYCLVWITAGVSAGGICFVSAQKLILCLLCRYCRLTLLVNYHSSWVDAALWMIDNVRLCWDNSKEDGG